MASRYFAGSIAAGSWKVMCTRSLLSGGRCSDMPCRAASRYLAKARSQALRRAVSNLVDNALRYAGAENPIELGLTTTPDETAIEVRDLGPGIPPDDVERVKRPFARLESARTNAVGAGLGLAIVDRVARAHDGRLELLPREGGGLVARIVLGPAARGGLPA